MDARSQISAARLSDDGNSHTVNNSATYPPVLPLNDPDLRLILANRFRRMLRLHDRARDQLLASPPAQPR